MNSLIFRTAANFLLIITMIFSIWVLFRGHNSPGGGFIGGLIGASGFAVYLLANGAKALRNIIKLDFSAILCTGLFLLILSGLYGLFNQQPFLKAQWIKITFLGLTIGTPIIFDLGVYLLVLGSVLIIITSLEESK